MPKSFIDSDGNVTGEFFARIFTNELYIETLLRTLKIALLATAINLLAGYPTAYLLSRIRQRTANLLMGVILLSFWTSLLVRTYSWMVILQRTGILNKTLVAIGILNEPRTFMYTEAAILIGMTNILLPYMILPIYSVLKGLDPNLKFAARSLGATGAEAFFKVTLPLSAPGVASGVLLVFIQSLGFYITPLLLGGPETMMITGLIDKQMFTYLNWNFGSAIGMVLLLITVIFLMGFEKLFGVDKLSKGLM
ncbi:MAG: ABC transporter permease [Clostridiales Family XIII bacterium]|nr:ABC transporter permease [Clostridiales Family XIII bacterium]